MKTSSKISDSANNKSQLKYYEQNEAYSKRLHTQNRAVFIKYVEKVSQIIGPGGRFLDVGCGTGIALSQFSNKVQVEGVDVSEPSVAICVEQGIKCQRYNGDSLPFDGSTFKVVGSYDVLEHVENPESFLNEMYRVCSDDGYLVIVCPNFLSITNSYHPHTKGVMRKFANSMQIVKKLVRHSDNFEKMPVIVRDDFQSDDDACNVTNPLDILYWGRRAGLSLQYWSGRSNHLGNPTVNRVLDRLPFKLVLGSSFMIFRKG